MATLEESKAQISQVRQQLEAQRTQAREAETKAQEQLRQIQTAEQKLPKNNTQRALRQTMGGLAGQLKRKAIASVKDKISGQKQQVKTFSQEIEDYKQQLTKYEEEQIKPVEAEIKRVEEYNQAVKVIEKAASKGMVWAYAMYGTGLVQKLAKEYVKNENLARQSLRKEVEKFELANPTEKLNVDWKNLQIKGVESGALGTTLSVKDYNKTIQNLQNQTNLEVKELETKPLDVNLTLPSNIKPTFLQKVAGALSFGIPSVSAKGLNNQNTSKINDISIPDRIPNRVDRGSNFISSIGTGVSDFVGNIIEGRSEGKKEGLQTGFTGNVISAYDPTKEITIYTPPKQTFLQKIGALPGLALVSAREFSSDVASLRSSESLMGIGNVGSVGNREITSFGVPVARLEQVKQIDTRLNTNIPKINQLDTQIKDLETKFVRGDEFIGSDNDYKEYSKVYEERNKLYEQIEQDQSRRGEISQVRTGFFKRGGATTDVSQFNFNKPFATGFSLFTAGVSGTVENLAFLGGKKDIGKETTLYQEQYGTIQTDQFGKEVPFFKPETRIITEEDVRSRANILGKTAGFTAGAGLFATPLGTPLALLMTGETLGSYGFNPSRFWKESTIGEKVEVGLLAGSLLGTGALRGVRYAKQPLLFETETGFRLTTRGQNLFGKRIRVSNPKDGIGIKTEYLPSKRGTFVDFLEIKQPKANVKASETLGLDTGKKVLYPEQILEQSSTAGRRTVVKKVTGLKDKTIYEGIPTDKVGREKALNILGDNFGEQGAKNILRYTAPQIRKVKLSEGILNIKNKRATGEFTFLKEQPVIKIDETLGIKTRGGKSIKTTEYVDRLSIGQKEKLGIALEDSSSIITFPRKGVVDLKGFDFKKGISIAQGSEVNKLGNLMVERIKGVSVKTYMPRDNKIFIDTGRTTLLKPIKKEETIGFRGAGKKSSQQYFQDLYSLKQVPQVKISTPKSVPKSPSVKLEIPTPKSEVNLITKPSSYAGTGLYERTDSVSVINIPAKTETLTMQPSMIDSGQDVSPEQIISTRPKLERGVKNEFFQPIRESNVNIIKPFSNIKIDIKQKIKPREDYKYNQIVTTVETRPKTTTKTTIRPRTTYRTKEPLRPKKPKIKIPFPDDDSLKRRRIIKKRKEVPEEFLAITKRRGKELVVGIGRTAQEAEQIGKRDALGTLGATVKVKTKSGRQVQLAEDRTFRRSKTDPLAIVQRREARLGSLGERREIKESRRGGVLSLR